MRDNEERPSQGRPPEFPMTFYLDAAVGDPEDFYLQGFQDGKNFGDPLDVRVIPREGNS
jgi:hypothetical protein